MGFTDLAVDAGQTGIKLPPEYPTFEWVPNCLIVNSIEHMANNKELYHWVGSPFTSYCLHFYSAI